VVEILQKNTDATRKHAYFSTRIYTIICWICLSEREVFDKGCRKIWETRFMFNSYFRISYAFQNNSTEPNFRHTFPNQTRQWRINSLTEGRHNLLCE